MSGTKRIAPAGTIWVCAACGKTSRDRFGDKGSEWDESCMLNSVLCEETMRPNEKGPCKRLTTVFSIASIYRQVCRQTERNCLSD